MADTRGIVQQSEAGLAGLCFARRRKSGGDRSQAQGLGETAAYHLHEGKRYRLRMRTASDDIHPVHLHRHSFELAKIAGKSLAGVRNDVVMVGGYQEIEVDSTADNPGPTVFHGNQQLHADFGFMALFDRV